MEYSEGISDTGSGNRGFLYIFLTYSNSPRKVLRLRVSMIDPVRSTFKVSLVVFGSIAKTR